MTPCTKWGNVYSFYGARKPSKPSEMKSAIGRKDSVNGYLKRGVMATTIASVSEAVNPSAQK